MFHLLSHAVHQPLQALDIIIGVILFVAALALLLVPDLAVKVVAVLVMTACVLAMIYIGDPFKATACADNGVSRSLGDAVAFWCFHGDGDVAPLEVEQDIRVAVSAPDMFWGIEVGGGDVVTFGLRTDANGNGGVVFSSETAVSYSKKSCPTARVYSFGLACYVGYPLSPGRSYRLVMTADHVPTSWGEVVGWKADVIDNLTRKVTPVMDVRIPDNNDLLQVRDEAVYSGNPDAAFCNVVPRSVARFGPLTVHPAGQGYKYYQLGGFMQPTCARVEQGSARVSGGGTAADAELTLGDYG